MSTAEQTLTEAGEKLTKAGCALMQAGCGLTILVPILILAGLLILALIL